MHNSLILVYALIYAQIYTSQTVPLCNQQIIYRSYEPASNYGPCGTACGTPGNFKLTITSWPRYEYWDYYPVCYNNAECGSVCTYRRNINAIETITSCSACKCKSNYIDISNTCCILNCTAGTYKTGCVTCTNCPTGTWYLQCSCPTNSMYVNNTCMCNEGSYRTSPSVCSACQPGYVCTNQVMTSCAPGTMAPVAQMTSCISCQPGSFSVAANASVCLACAPGAYNNASQSTVCTICDPGTFAANLSSTVCEICPPGTYGDGFARSACTGCQAGTFGNVLGATECLGCPENAYTDRPAQTECTFCPDFATAPPFSNTSAACECGAGRWISLPINTN
jgi:hypothetical protein